jgi:GT2 family glycosyltransferase
MAAGFNAALPKARGDIIVMLGGHTVLDRGYVRSCVTLLQEGRAECVGGVVETVGDTRESEAIALAMGSRFGVGGARFRTGTRSEQYVDTVAFGVYTREAIERTGLLDEELIRDQDDEYNYRFRKLGGRILLTPDARCTYFSRSSMRSLFRQYFAYGFWKVRVMQKHPAQMRPRQFVPPIFLAALVLPLLMAAVWPSALWIAAGVAALYVIANLTASVSLARSAGWPSALRLPLAFATLHVSYGLGILVGTVRFARGWV